MHELSFIGNSTTFSVTDKYLESYGLGYDELFDVYEAPLDLLKFSQKENILIVNCKNKACLSHQSIPTGCDENGICANVSVTSTRKELLSATFKFCNATAAAGAADGLNELSRQIKMK